ncbi:ABC transporter ATP-binding protein [Micromonospora sp. NBS 11-29]|uniref:ABC transporter ATP-binding protein n=1 Tax=Micromonospora sp. NBS 11-29 TaxID=1960879 RepID=UPI000B780077|nr:ABC transporter ATP-binding protein [Micromonospora sp. NBS 11-29]
MVSDHALLQITGLHKSYRARERSVDVLTAIDLSVRDGEFATVVGTSGCGKTTLLKIVAGLVPATSGEVLFDGSPVTGPPPGLGVVFQEYGRSLFPWKTVRQNVELPLRRNGSSRAQRRGTVDEALDAVGLGKAADAYPWQLSGGMQQRVAIARAVAYRPRLLLMDEPFSAVDAQTRGDLEDLVAGLRRRFRMTVLFVTHDIDEAVYLGDRVIVLGASVSGVQADIPVTLPADRDQITTRSSADFGRLRAEVWAQVRRTPLEKA